MNRSRPKPSARCFVALPRYARLALAVGRDPAHRAGPDGLPSWPVRSTSCRRSTSCPGIIPVLGQLDDLLVVPHRAHGSPSMGCHPLGVAPTWSRSVCSDGRPRHATCGRSASIHGVARSGAPRRLGKRFAVAGARGAGTRRGLVRTDGRPRGRPGRERGQRRDREPATRRRGPSGRPGPGLSGPFPVGMASCRGHADARKEIARDRRPRGHDHATRTRSTSPTAGHTKLDLVHYYLAVADGALRGRGRPADGAQALRQRRRRRVLLPEARARQPARLDRDRRAVVPVRPHGRRDRPRDAAGLAWIVNLGCIDLNPHPVRADDLDHPDELRVDLDPVPGVAWSQIREVALVAQGGARRTSASSAGRRRRARAASTSTSASSGAGRTRRCAARRWRSPATSSGARPRSRPASGGRRSATASSSTTTRTPRTGPSRRRTRSGRLPDARVSMPLALGRGARRRGRGLHARDRARRCSRSIGDPGAGIDEAVGSLEPLLELSARARGARARATRRGRRTTASRRASRRASSRRASGGPTRSTTRPRPRRSARRTGPRWSAARRARLAPSGRGRRPTCAGTKPTPTGRRRSIDPGDRDRPGRDEGRGARRASSAGRSATRRPRPRSSRRTCWSTGCAAARRCGTGSAST